MQKVLLPLAGKWERIATINWIIFDKAGKIFLTLLDYSLLKQEYFLFFLRKIFLILQLLRVVLFI